jgi:hypothetical protein
MLCVFRQAVNGCQSRDTSLGEQDVPDLTTLSHPKWRQDILPMKGERHPTFGQAVTESEAGCAPFSGQDVVGEILPKNIIVSLLTFFTARLVSTGCSSACKKTRESKKAGDGTRTRDSLLGRQSPARSPLASSKTALQAHRALVNQIRTDFTQGVLYTLKQDLLDHH